MTYAINGRIRQYAKIQLIIHKRFYFYCYTMSDDMMITSPQ